MLKDASLRTSPCGCDHKRFFIEIGPDPSGAQNGPKPPVQSWLEATSLCSTYHRSEFSIVKSSFNVYEERVTILLAMAQLPRLALGHEPASWLPDVPVSSFSKMQSGNGHTKVSDEKRSGQPVEVGTPFLESQIDALIRDNRRITFELKSIKINASVGTVHKTIHNKLQYKKTCEMSAQTTHGRS
ncbi:hypothetical protein J6590_064022 [Homalodisca vitripennis]|nr:hypothetical protein J6590_064022 [Homalodisca vitripennis]